MSKEVDDIIDMLNDKDYVIVQIYPLGQHATIHLMDTSTETSICGENIAVGLYVRRNLYDRKHISDNPLTPYLKEDGMCDKCFQMIHNDIDFSKYGYSLSQSKYVTIQDEKGWYINNERQ
jgi:hypothetical protein